MGRIAAAILGALALCGVGWAQAPVAPFRLAVIAPAQGPCAAPGPDAPEGARAYAAHLGHRLGREVQLCPVADPAAGAALLAGGGADMALLNSASYPAVRTQVRALLTPRAGVLGRIETVAVTLSASPRAGLAGVVGARLAFGGSAPFALAEPQRALRDHGFDPAQLTGAQVLAEPEAAAAALRGNAADVVILHSAAWQRLCRPSSVSQTPCAGLKEIWRGRPTAATAWAIRRDLDRELRFRLVGIHVALHRENRPAFEWIAPGAPEIEPCEAEALVIGPRP